MEFLIFIIFSFFFRNRCPCYYLIVPQDDIVHSTLTVRENLLYSALMRLPEDMQLQQKLDNVEDALGMLGLSRIQDSIVGNAEKRGISGGKRKRVNICKIF